MSTRKEVTRDEFHATVGQMNVHPRPEKTETYWEAPDRTLMGVTTPGYLMVGEVKYFIIVD